MHWSAPFIGMPHLELGRTMAGADCWGLVYLVLAAQGIAVASYAGDYASIDEKAEIAALIGGAKASANWRAVTLAQPLDVVTFRQGRIDGHVGVVVTPGRMLHVGTGTPACIENYTAPRWAARLTGIWRHATL